MNIKSHRIALLAATAVTLLGGVGGVLANHAWANYHWARTANPFTLKVVDSVTSTWDAYLIEAKNDWSVSSVLDLTTEAGSTGSTDRRRCRPVSGKIRACNYTYGNNGWLGLAQIWVNTTNHITQATTQVNDTYFNTSTYNTPAWRRLVMCQEIAHDFGLDHQDETFGNPNLGTCMDYTSDPDGPPSNEHPNAHDYEQLETIYAHLDSTTTVKSSVVQAPFGANSMRAALTEKFAGLSEFDRKEMRVEMREMREDMSEFGEALRQDRHGRTSLFMRKDLEGGKVYTFIIWAE